MKTYSQAAKKAVLSELAQALQDARIRKLRARAKPPEPKKEAAPTADADVERMKQKAQE